jgi:hypothetical protein
MSFNKKFFTTGGIVASTPAGGGNPVMANATLVNTVTLTVGSRGNPRGGMFSFDGTRLFTTHLDGSGNDWIQQYNIGIGFDISTLGTTVVKEKQLTASIPDYLSGATANLDNTWFSYDPYGTNNYYSQPFGTAGDVSTLGALNTDTCNARGGGDQTSTAQMISKDGNYLFMLGSGRTMYRPTLSTTNDLSSASGCGISNSLSAIETSLGAIPSGFNFNSDGTKFYQFVRNGKVATFDLSTAWDVSTRSNQITDDLATDLDSPNSVYAIQFNDDYTKMLILTANGSYTTWKVHEFDL